MNFTSSWKERILIQKTSTILRVRKNKVDYEIGLPAEFDLVKPWYVKESTLIEDVSVNLRPRYLLKADCQLQVRIVEGIARGINEEPCNGNIKSPIYGFYLDKASAES